jgi:hypothetical protein
MTGFVVFELCTPNGTGSVKHTKTGFVRAYPPSFSIPAFTVSLDEKGDARNLSYVPSQKSVWAEEHTNVGSTKVQKPRFNNGILLVKDNQKNLLEFLRRHPWNEKNKDWGVSKVKSAFRERNVVEMTQKRNAEIKKITNATRMVYELDFTTKILPIAQYLGFETNTDSSSIIYDMLMFAQANPERFIELLDSEMVDRQNTVNRAAKLGIIRTTPDTISWADGRQIVKVPQSHNPVEYLAKVSFDTNYHGTWAEINRQLDNLGQNKPAPDAVATNPPSLAQELGELTVQELFERAREANIIKWEHPFFLFADKKIRTKEGFYEEIRNNKNLKQTIIASLVSLS